MLIIIRKIALISLLLFTFTFVAVAADEPSVSASSAVLIDGDTLEILYEKGMVNEATYHNVKKKYQSQCEAANSHISQRAS